jgi:phosphatidylserine decarboxylase
MFARKTIPWVVIPLLSATLSLVLAIILTSWLVLSFAIAMFILTGLFVIFFRDPERRIGDGIVAPADGKIIDLGALSERVLKIAIFMNLWNVHVNRAPLDCEIKKIIRLAGGHKPAYKKTAVGNEKVLLELATELGTVKLVQVAGSLARKIYLYVKEGQKLKKGERFGLIKFGSRVELYLPSEKIVLKVKLGNKVLAGKTTLALVK